MTSLAESTVGTTKLANDNIAIPLEIGTPITVKAIGDKAGVYASYITLTATDPAQLALLATYGITGYNKVNRTTNEFVLNVANAAADGKQIGFKLWTVDFLGTTKLDRTFSLACGKKNTGNPELKATLTPDTYQASSSYDMPKAVAMTTVLAANDADAKNLEGSTVSVELKDAAGTVISGVNATLYKKDLTTSVTIGSDFKAIKEIAAVKLTGINLQQIADNGSVTGKLLFKNTTGLELLSVPVTLTKTMSAFPSTFGAKTGILANGIIKVYPTFVSGGKATYEYAKIFNGINATIANAYYNFNYTNQDPETNADLKAGNVDFNNNISLANTQIGVENKLVGSQGHTIATAVTYNFGQISSVKENSAFVNFLTTWNTPFALQFASIPEESELKLADKVVVNIDYPTEKFVLGKAKISYKSIVDATDLKLEAIGDIKTITVKTLSGDNTVNEYYEPSIAAIASAADVKPVVVVGDIVFEKKSNAAALTVDVPSKLVFTITDVFGNKFDKVVNFTVKKNQ